VTFYSHAHQLDCTDHIIDQLIEAMRPSLEEVAPEVGSFWGEELGICLGWISPTNDASDVVIYIYNIYILYVYILFW